MKKITIICNSALNPIKFPADLKYFYARKELKVGEIKAEIIAKEWATKNKMVLFKVDVTTLRPEQEAIEQAAHPGELL